MSTAPNTPTRKTSSTKPGPKSGSRSAAKPAGTATARPAGKAAPKSTATVGPVTVQATTQRTSAAPAAPHTATRRVLRGTPRAAAKPLLAAVGVADLALEQVKDVQEAYVAEARKVQSRLADVPQQVRTLPTQVRTLPTQVRTIPAQVRSLRDEVESRVETVTDRANDLYTSLTERGERLVTQIRQQPTMQAAIAEGKEALRQAEAAAAAAQKSFQAGERAVSDAASTIG